MPLQPIEAALLDAVDAASEARAASGIHLRTPPDGALAAPRRAPCARGVSMVGGTQETPVARSLRILVVEDNEDIGDLMEMVLSIEGHVVRRANDGVSGLAALLADPPQVAVLDIGLPGMDGYEIAERFRASDVSLRTILIALTGYGRPQDRARALAVGFDEHMVKPVEPDALLAWLNAQQMR